MRHKMLERLVFFSDAVFAIAITLLVIDIGIPHVVPHGGDVEVAAIQALLGRLPQLIGFVTSFLVIGAFWAAHHRTFGMIEHHDPVLVWPNLHLLLMIAFLPFATGFMSANSGLIVPNIFYALCLLAVAMLQARLFRIALRTGLLPGIGPEQVAAVKRRSWAVVIPALLAIPASLVVRGWAMLVFLLVPVLVRTLGRERHGDDPEPPAPAPLV